MANLDASTFDVNARLDENYLFLLPFVERPMKQFTEEKKILISKWLVKLGTQSEAQNTQSKWRRNDYLNQLLSNMNNGQLTAPFDAAPSQGELTDAFSLEHTMLPGEDEWLLKLNDDAKKKTNVGGRDFETYLSTKLFKDGCGACAYLAVSVRNEGEKKGWAVMDPNKDKAANISAMFKKELPHYCKQQKSFNESNESYEKDIKALAMTPQKKKK